MKKLLPVLLISCAVVLFAKTEIPVMKKVTVHNIQTAKTGGKLQSKGNSTQEQHASVSPLDEPFTPRYVYPGTDISKNIIPIHMVKPDAVDGGECSAFRFRRNWILTAAHCMEVVVGTNTHNQRIYSSVDKQDDGLVFVTFAPVDAQHPSNASLYFYKQGYTSAAENGFCGHSEDIALIRLDDVDTSIPTAQANMAQTVEEFSHVRAQFGEIFPKNNSLATSIDSGHKLLQKEQKRLNDKQKLRRNFLNEPLNNYLFFVLNPVQAAELNGKSVKTTRFNGGYPNRQFPDSFVWQYKGLQTGSNHVVGWTFNDSTVRESGSPLIRNGFVVSVASGPYGHNTRVTPLFTERFRNFLVESMGAEYPTGLCVQPTSAEPLPVFESHC